MMRSLYSGVSGLRIHQTKMDVIGNNISNVNTVGFKSSSVNFSDIFYQTTQSATGPNDSTGAVGRNAMQIGLGSNVASITTSILQTGGAQRTDNPFDVMITGDSFFVVKNSGTNYFTKAGAFNVDANGTLCTPSGATVMGWLPDSNDTTKTLATAVKPLQIMSPDNLYSAPEATTEAYITGNIDSKDPQIADGASGKTVNVSFFDNMGYSYTADLNIMQSATDPSQYTVSIKDIKDENGTIFGTKDATGAYTDNAGVTFSFGGTGAAAIDPSVAADGTVTISGATWPTLEFDSGTGKFKTVGDSAAATTSDKISLSITSPAKKFKPINIDFSTITMYSTSGSSSLEANKGDLDGKDTGKKVGNMTGVNIDTSGKIYGKYDNGDSLLLGQIAVASFSNPAGLESVGNSMFAETQNSGQFDGIGQDISLNGGSLTTGVLEMSNVDLSQQFTDMITTQRGFQANSRIITTSDTLLEELINLKR